MTRDQYLRKNQKNDKLLKYINFLDICVKCIPVSISLGSILAIIYYSSIFDTFGINLNFFDYNISFIFQRAIMYFILFITGLGSLRVVIFGKLLVFIYTLLFWFSIFFYLFYTLNIFNYLDNSFINFWLYLIIIFLLFIMPSIITLFFTFYKKTDIKRNILQVVSLIFIIIEFFSLVNINYSNLNYSILKQENQEDKIILFKANDKIFISDFYVDENNICTIYTKNYEIKKYENIKVENRTFKDVIIDKENLKKPNKNDEVKQEVTTENKIETTTKTTTEKTIGEQTKSTTENLTEETQEQDKREEIENGQNPT